MKNDLPPAWRSNFFVDEKWYKACNKNSGLNTLAYPRELAISGPISPMGAVTVSQVTSASVPGFGNVQITIAMVFIEVYTTIIGCAVKTIVFTFGRKPIIHCTVTVYRHLHKL